MSERMVQLSSTVFQREDLKGMAARVATLVATSPNAVAVNVVKRVESIDVDGELFDRLLGWKLTIETMPHPAGKEGGNG